VFKGPWTNLSGEDVLRVVTRSNYRDMLVCGDSKGRIRLYKYPCTKEKVHSFVIVRVSVSASSRLRGIDASAQRESVTS